MKRITPKLIKQLHKKMPFFIDSVEMVKAGKGMCIVLTLDAFDDAELFYTAMWYAHSENVIVQLVPHFRMSIPVVGYDRDKLPN